MSIKNILIEKAKSKQRKIIYPESTEPRILNAARRCIDDGVIKEALLVGKKDGIINKCKEINISDAGFNIIEPEKDSEFERLSMELYSLRKHKGMTEDQARVESKKSLIFANLLLRTGRGDGIVTGSITTTGDVVRAAVTIVKPAEGVKIVSSSFIMETPNSKYGDIFIFTDAGVMPNPTSEELPDIAFASSLLFRKLIGDEPRIAFLSFSTKGSAEHPDADKVKEAVKIFKDKHPEIKADGELQADAAIVEAVGKRKAPDSDIAGKANILVFPDLDAANISYKLVERLGGANAFGPVLQGLSKPVNDLSRGCSIEDIYVVSAITSLLSD